jgi:hypothetical protein
MSQHASTNFMCRFRTPVDMHFIFKIAPVFIWFAVGTYPARRFWRVSSFLALVLGTCVAPLRRWRRKGRNAPPALWTTLETKSRHFDMGMKPTMPRTHAVADNDTLSEFD